MNARTVTLLSASILTLVSVAATAQSSRARSHKAVSKSSRAASAAPKASVPTPTATVTLMGEFGKPGDIAFAPGMTVRTAVIAAGGFSADADARSITLRRAGAASLAKIDGQAAMEGDLVQNAVLKPGDVLVVMPKKQEAAVAVPEPTHPQAVAQAPAPEAAPQVKQAANPEPASAPNEPERQVVKIVGEVAHPGVYEYKPMSMQDVLKLVGLNKDAEKCKIVIYRGSPADPAQATKIQYDLDKVAKGQVEDTMLQPGDIVEVPKHKKYNLFNDVIGHLKPSKAVLGVVEKVAPLALNGIAPGAGALGMLAK